MEQQAKTARPVTELDMYKKQAKRVLAKLMVHKGVSSPIAPHGDGFYLVMGMSITDAELTKELDAILK